MVEENLNNDMIPVGTTFHINPEDIKWELNGGDLISREALKKYARVVFDKDLGRLRVVDVSDIDNAPAVEYTFEEAFQKTVCEQRLYCPERLIRCKDCKHTVLSENGKTLICCLTMKVGTVKPDFYCGNGEKKGGAENG